MQRSVAGRQQSFETSSLLQHPHSSFTFVSTQQTLKFSNLVHVDPHPEDMGCFSGSCFSPNTGLPAKRNVSDVWAASVQWRGAKCQTQENTQESVTAEGLQACYTAAAATEYSSGGGEMSAEEADTSSLSSDQVKSFSKVANGIISRCLVGLCLLLLLLLLSSKHPSSDCKAHLMHRCAAG